MNNSLERSMPWLVAFGVIVVIAATLDLTTFSDCSFSFRFNAFLVILIPLSLLEATVGWLVWLAKSLGGSARARTTVRGSMAAVAALAVILGTGRWWVNYNFATVYAPGYREENFRRVKLGMTAKEVETIVGQPLLKDSTSRRWSPYENWIYSQAPPPGTVGDNYWRRWIMIDQGKVSAIVDDYYID